MEPRSDTTMAGDPVVAEIPTSGFLGAVDSSIADRLLSQQKQFRAFLASRLGSEADVDDLLQDTLVKALRSTSGLRDEEKLTAWFYQVLRNAIVDHVRSRNAARAREQAWATEAAVADDESVSRHICACFAAVLPQLPSREAELIQRVELENQSVAEVARALAITPNHASVALHRARRALREKLEAFCGSCAGPGCLDCDCP